MQSFRTLGTLSPTAKPVDENYYDIDPMIDFTGVGVLVTGMIRGRASLVVGSVGSSAVLRSLDRPLGVDGKEWLGWRGDVVIYSYLRSVVVKKVAMGKGFGGYLCSGVVDRKCKGEFE